MGKIYEQLSVEERTKIQMQLEEGFSPAAIALGLNRSPSTISRELRRNGWSRPKARRSTGRPLMAGGYRSEGAHKRAHTCRGHASHPAAPAARERVVEAGHGIFAIGLFARADFWHTENCASKDAHIAGVPRNHLHGDLRHATW